MSSHTTTTSYDLPVTTTVDDAHNNNVVNTKRYTKRAQALDCFKLILFLTLIIVLLGLVPGVTRFLLFLQPNTPEFKIQSTSLAVLNVSRDSVTADLDVTVLVHNTNKKDIILDEIVSFLLKDNDEKVSNVSISPLEASRNSETSLRGEFKSVVENCSFDSCGNFSLKVEFEVEAKYEGFTWPTRRDKIRVLCDSFRVPVNLTTSTRLNLGSSECDSNGRWKRLVTKCDTIFWNYIYVATVFIAILLLSL